MSDERLREALERLLRQQSRGGRGLGFNADMHEETVVDAILADPDVLAALAHDRPTLAAAIADANYWRERALAHDRPSGSELVAKALDEALAVVWGPGNGTVTRQRSVEEWQRLFRLLSDARAALSGAKPESPA
jgi:ABC-type branched-subunit amino acid transport system substrate-binding protein